MEAPSRRRRRTEGRGALYKQQRRLGWIYSLLVTAAVICLIFLLWMIPIRVRGDSMAPDLMDGETVLCDRLYKYWKAPARGDAVLFETEKGRFIKRIVGLPGETVEIIGGYVYIDSRPLNEDAYAHDYLGDMPPVLVPEDGVFLLGDNRSKIYDSRLAEVGCIPYRELLGVLRVRVSPIDRLTLFF